MHEAIKDCVHDLAHHSRRDRRQSRIELQCLELSRQMTEQARRAEAGPEA
jgi:signal transduction histidine kinase